MKLAESEAACAVMRRFLLARQRDEGVDPCWGARSYTGDHTDDCELAAVLADGAGRGLLAEHESLAQAHAELQISFAEQCRLEDGYREEWVLARNERDALAARLAESDAALREILSLITARNVVTAADVDAASAAVPDVVMRVRTCEARIEASEADAAAMREVLTEAADWIESAVDIISEDDEDDPDNDRARYVAERCRLLGDGAAGRKLLDFVAQAELATEALTGDGDNGCATGEPEHLCAGCRQDVWHGMTHGDGCSVARLIVALEAIGVTIASGRRGRVVEASDA